MFSLLLAGVAAAATYKWVDKNGVVHYSDRPVPGAVLVDLGKTQTYTPPVASERNRQQPDPTAPVDSSYRDLDLWRPYADETFRNTGNVVPVRLRLEPELRPGHSIWIYLDGRRVDGLPETGDSFELTEIWRGTHTLTAMVVDGDGKQIIRSQTVTFHMHQTGLMTPGSRVNRTPPPSAGGQ
jgi:hypothetical protein